MAARIQELPAVDPDSEHLNVVVDTPKGSRNKYKIDEKRGVWRLSKVLPQGMSFPYDFGYLPGTRGEDGDPVDVRKSLQAHLREVRKRVLDEQNTLAVVAETIRRERDGVRQWMKVRNKWRSAALGLKETYRRAKISFEAAKVDRTDEKLHEWRKQAKYLLYQLEILRPLWTERLDEMVNEVDQVGNHLGDDHDLVVLRQMVDHRSEKPGAHKDRETLLALIDRRRDELQQEVMLLGERFFQDKVSDFARRFSGYWKTWQDQVQQGCAAASDR
jgi:hypothetical protein